MDKRLIRGIAASLGEATGVVRHFDEDSPFERYTEATILVAEYIPPNVASFDMHVRGFVVEESSLLCHAASMARELRIPCIVGVENALDVLDAGAHVRMNGGTGEIQHV